MLRIWGVLILGLGWAASLAAAKQCKQSKLLRIFSQEQAQRFDGGKVGVTKVRTLERLGKHAWERGVPIQHHLPRASYDA